MRDYTLSTIPPFLDGVYLGVNAVSDAYLVIDCPQGCYFKFEKISLNHDMRSSLYDPLGKHRIIQSGFHYDDLVMGTETLVRKLIKKIKEKTGSPIIFLTQGSVSVITSCDFNSLAKNLSEELSIPVVYIPPRTFDGDYLDGYESFMEKLQEMLINNPAKRRGNKKGICISGYFADRLEEDHLSNIRELSFLINSLGLSCSGIIASGTSFSEAKRAYSSPIIINLPYCQKFSKFIAKGKEIIQVNFPIGIGGTIKFLREIGEKLDKSERAERLINEELKSLVPQINFVRNRYLIDRSVIISADPYVASGLIDFVSELGMNIPLVAVRTRREERLKCVYDAIKETGIHPQVIYDYSVNDLKKTINKVKEGMDIDLIIGSSFERSVAFENKIGFIEIGFPSFIKHAFYSSPILGFNGARRLVNDLINAVQERDFINNL